MPNEQDPPAAPHRDPAGLTGRAARGDPGPVPSVPSGGACDYWPDPDEEPRRWSGWLLLTGGVFAVLLGPAVVQLVTSPPGGLPLVGLLVAVAALVVLFIRLSAVQVDVAGGQRAVPWLELGAFVVLAAGLATRGSSWVPALGLAALIVALHLPPGVTGVAVAALTGLAGVLGWLGSGDAASAVVLMLAAGVMGGFGYLSRRSMVLSAQLLAIQQELAGMAVAQERLRIAGELHDLLGHSLSVIALKAELAGSLLTDDPEGARGEIGEVEAVARRSLGEVREAVTGYRRPTLAAELAGARRSVAAAGIACQVEAPANAPSRRRLTACWPGRSGRAPPM